MAREPRRRHALTRANDARVPSADTEHFVPPVHGRAGGVQGDFRTYASILKRRAGLIRNIFLAVVGLTLLVGFLRSPVYRASALLEIRQGEGDIPSLAGLFEDGEPSEEYRRTHFELLRSATLAGRVIQGIRLDTLSEFAPEDDTPLQAMIGRFAERLIVAPVPDSRLVRLTFESRSPETSAAVVNAIVDTYTELRREARASAARRLALQADSVEARLQEAEQRLKEYTDANDLPYLVEEDATTELGTRLRDLRDRLAAAQGARYESETLYDMVVEQGQVDLVDDVAIQGLEAQLSELRRDYSRLSSTFTDDYPETAEVLGQIEQVEGLIEQERRRASLRVGSQYQLAMEREEMLAQAIEDQEEIARELAPQSGGHHLLRQAVLANRTLYATLTERQREAETAAAIGSTDFSVVDPAVPPLTPHRPVFGMTFGLALMLGLVLGVGSALVKEMMDDTVHNAEDLPIATDVPILGLIPAHGAQGARAIGGPMPRKGSGRLARSSGSRATTIGSQAAEGRGGWLRIDSLEKGDPSGNTISDAFAALRTAVLFRNEGAQPRSILVSSCRAGEGKTTVSVNLAMSLARLGHRVLLVDADLRRPAVHQVLNLHAAPGLVNCLRPGVDWKNLVRFGAVDGLDVLASGGATSHAADLLAGNRMEVLLRDAEARYDFVIVDAPALFINPSDAKVLARLVDGVVVVVRSQSTPRSLVDRIPRDVPNLMGVVVNDLSESSLPDYFGDYFAEYGGAGNGEDPATAGVASGVPHVRSQTGWSGDTDPEGSE